MLTMPAFPLAVADRPALFSGSSQSRCVTLTFLFKPSSSPPELCALAPAVMCLPYLHCDPWRKCSQDRSRYNVFLPTFHHATRHAGAGSGWANCGIPHAGLPAQML